LISNIISKIVRVKICSKYLSVKADKSYFKILLPNDGPILSSALFASSVFQIQLREAISVNLYFFSIPKPLHYWNNRKIFSALIITSFAYFVGNGLKLLPRPIQSR